MLQGFINTVTVREIIGWIYDSSFPDKSIVISLYSDRFIGKTEANIYLDDLKNAGYGNGNHGFRIEIKSDNNSNLININEYSKLFAINEDNKEIFYFPYFNKFKHNEFPYILNDIARSELNICLLGTCMTDELVSKFRRARVTQYLYGSFLHENILIDHKEYDAIVFHLTLRHILQQALGVNGLALSFDNNLFTDSFINNCYNIINNIFSSISLLPQKCPKIILSIVETPVAVEGFVGYQRRRSLNFVTRAINDFMSEESAKRGFYFLEINDIVNYFGTDVVEWTGNDSYFRFSAHASVRGNQVLSAITNRIENSIYVINYGGPKIKLIITDLDNTLWNGVAAENEQLIPLEMIELHVSYAEALKICKRRGVLLAISSKNDRNFIEENFNKIYYPNISLEDFCTIKCDWRPKSEQVLEIINEVGILADSILFIDDNINEIEEVRRVIPNINTLHFQHPTLARNILLYLPELNTPLITEDAENKTSLIKRKIEIDRNIRDNSFNRENYLRDLKIELTLSRLKLDNKNDRNRVRELINKTNQFNTTGIRLTDAELVLFVENDGIILYTSMRDNNNNYGIISVILLSSDLVIENLVLSCRVFGYGVESAVLSVIQEKFCSENMAINFKDTGKNAVAFKSLSDLGFLYKEGVFIKSTPIIKPSWINCSLNFDV